MVAISRLYVSRKQHNNGLRLLTGIGQLLFRRAADIARSQMIDIRHAIHDMYKIEQATISFTPLISGSRCWGY